VPTHATRAGVHTAVLKRQEQVAGECVYKSAYQINKINGTELKYSEIN